MTVQSDLQKAIAQAESMQGTYANFATSTQDPAAKKMFQEFEADMLKHINSLQGRLNYVQQNNPAYQQQQQQQQQWQQQQQ